MIMNLERFVIRSIFALYPGLPRNGMWNTTNAITNGRQHEDEIEFFSKQTLHIIRNEDSVIRGAVQEHRAVLWLVNQIEKVSDMRKDGEGCRPLILRYFVFLDREIERKAEMELGVGKKEEAEKREVALLRKRLSVVPLFNIKSHFVTIDSAALYVTMKEISPEFDVRKIEFTGENRETYRKNIFDFKRLKKIRKRYSQGRSTAMEYPYAYPFGA